MKFATYKGSPVVAKDALFLLDRKVLSLQDRDAWAFSDLAEKWGVSHETAVKYLKKLENKQKISGIFIFEINWKERELRNPHAVLSIVF